MIIWALPHRNDYRESREGPIRAIETTLLRVSPGWAVLVAIDLAAALVVGGSWLHAAHLSALDRITLLAVEAAGAGILLLVVALACAAVGGLARFPAAWGSEADGPPAEGGPAVRWTRRSLLGLAFFFYLGSWATYHSTGRFVDGDSVELWTANPVQLLQHVVHMEPWTLLLVPAGALAATGFTERLGPWLGSRAEQLGTGRSARRYGLILALALLVAGQGHLTTGRSSAPVTDPRVGSVYSTGTHYSRIRSEHTGPLAHLAGEVTRALRDPFAGLRPAADLPVRYPGRIPLEEYAERVPDDWAPPANVVIVLVESLRADQLTDYGSERIVMPRVEALADRGRLWLDVYTQSSHSNYADLPPLSSQYPLRSEDTHVYRPDPPYPRVLIYDILEALGYRTAIFSSQNENWGGMIHYLRTGGLDTLVHAANYAGPASTPYGDSGFQKFVEQTGNAGKIDDRHTVAEALRWVRREEGPFFIYMNLQSSHVPYATPEDFETRFGPETVDFPIRFGRIPKDRLDVARDVYANSLAYVDSQIDRFMEGLEEAGLAAETIVVITGDTGQAFYEHGFHGHAGPLYDEVMRVPLVMSGGPVSSGRDRRPAEHVDVPPTLLHLLGLPPHPGFQGCDLLAAAPTGERRRYLVAQSPLAHQYAIVRDGWKLIYDAEFRERLLYDLRADPGERRDLSARRDSVAEALSGELGRWRTAQVDYYGDPALQAERYPPVIPDGCRRAARGGGGPPR